MIKHLIIATLCFVLMYGGDVSARMSNSATNHPSYWETSATTCAKRESNTSRKFTFSVSDPSGVQKIIVKGGPAHTVYSSGPFVNLTAPVNPNNNKNYAISHVIVCRDNGAGQGENGSQTETTTDTPNKPERPEVPSRPDVPANDKADKVTICHATGSATNRYVKITVSRNALGGHFNEMDTPRAGHLDDIMLDSADDNCPDVLVGGAGEAPVDKDDEPKDDNGEVASGETTRREDGKGAGAGSVESAADDRPAALPVTGGEGMIGLALFAGAVAAGSTLIARRYMLRA